MRAILLGGALCLAMTCAAQAQIARGKYIVERVGMCGDCHTPRDAKGEPIASKALQGAPLGLRPVHPMPFADAAPRIAGLPENWTLAQAATFLETGKRPNGTEPMPPMPPYRLSKDDALAVATYLKSLKPN
ncbi:MAG TPA: c-type cytochrome [Acetobacteraceae bacterium]|nr:c-type cytochrome [Acetobacteraceae bacterium]